MCCLPARKELKASALPGLAAKMKRKTVGFQITGSFIVSHTCPSSKRTLALHPPALESAAVETRGSLMGSVQRSVSALATAVAM